MKLRLSLAALVLALTLTACGNDTPAPAETTVDPDCTTATPVEEVAPVSLALIENGETAFSLLRSEEASTTIVKSVTNLHNAIHEKAGVRMSITTDWVKAGTDPASLTAPEVLIGQTNRPETAEVLAALPENSYTMQIKNNKLVIVGTDNSLTSLALYAFADKVLSNPDRTANGKLTVTEDDCFTETLDAPLSMKDKIESKHTLVSVSAGVAQTNRQGEYYIGQGSASDGTYVYFVLRNKNDTGSKITKHRLDDGSFVAVSEVLDLGHGNDMTYDTKNKRLVVAHGQSEGQILTIVDPETLAFVKDVAIPKGSGAITYNASKDRYAISQGGKTLHILDADFKHITSYSRSDNTGYTAQGMGSDDDYVYFPMSGSKDNKLVVYTWEGKHVTTLTITVDHESESMFWVNGKYYVAYNTAGEALYSLDFEILYE